MAKKPSSLSNEDAALWDKVKQSVTPLENRPAAPEIQPRKMVHDRLDHRPLPAEWHTAESPDPRRTIDRKTKRKISKGMQDVDRSVDLHGLTQDQAFLRLKSVIEGAIRRGDKTLLVVTGKGGKRFSQTGTEVPAAYRTREDFDQFGGVLKRVVPVWLEGPDLKPFVESYGEAAKEHGGEGALYLLLRKRLPGSRQKRKS